MIDQISIYALIFFGQLASSLLRTKSIHAVVGSSCLKATAITGLSDLFFYSVVAGVTARFISGDWTAIACAVLGGACGNYFAMKIRKK